jgi:formylglycine-generating enzyme required for sulfatase activity
MTSDERAKPLNVPGYEILRLIGRGGMGEVYLATQVSLNRPVALKVLSLAPRGDPAAQAARFRREAELMARIHHPNVVSVHDFGTVDGDGRPFLVMEYVEGSDLRQRLEPGKPLGADRVRPLIGPVTQALAFLHAHGILHCDLKPENILISPDGIPKVTDFGLAVLDSDAGSRPEVAPAPRPMPMGTIGYVAPEQQYRLGVDERSDQYSMAALVYELLTGQRPLGILKPPSQLNPRLNPRIDAALLRALQEDPDDRFPTIGEFGAALEQALDAGAPRPRRRPVLVAAAFVAVAVAGAVGWWARMSRPAAAARHHDMASRPAPPVPVPALLPAPAPTPARLVNSLKMTLVLLPAGEFLMGASASDDDAAGDERPQHRVRLSRPFYMGAHEVTVGAFRVFVAETGYQTEAESSGRGGMVYLSDTNRYEQFPQYNWRNPGLVLPQAEDEPVVQVSWNDAVAFCRWLSGREGRPYRLPTEAEWEYACRAGSSARWCMGDDPAQLDRFAWIRDESGLTTHTVGGKLPNDFGLHDMHGNVWEWCLDRYGPYPADTAIGAVIDPTGMPVGVMRVVRGGACAHGGLERTTSSIRVHRKPSYRYFKYGFRVCSPLVEPAEGR